MFTTSSLLCLSDPSQANSQFYKKEPTAGLNQKDFAFYYILFDKTRECIAVHYALL